MDKLSNEEMAKFMVFMQSQFAAKEEKTTSAEVATNTLPESPKPDVKATPFQTDDDEVNFNIKSDFLFEERIRSLTAQGKFYEAVSLYENIEYVDDTDVGLKLLIAECYLQLGRESKAEKAISDVEKILMKPPMFNVDDVMNLAKDLTSNSNCIRALLLLRIAFDTFMNDSALSPDDKIQGAFRCINKLDDVLDELNPKPVKEAAQNVLEIQKALAAVVDPSIDTSKFLSSKKKSLGMSERTRVLSLDYGVEVMEEMLGKIESIKNSDPETKALKLAKLANAVSLHYKAFKQFSKAVKVLQFTIDRLEKQFGKNARQHRIYGVTLFNIGSDFHIAHNFKEAELYTMRALEAVEYALDFETEEGKRQGIKGIQSGLRVIRSNLKMA